MKKAILAQKVLVSVLAIGLGGFVLPLAAQAASGGIYQNDKIYIGNKENYNQVVIVDGDEFIKVYGILKQSSDAVGNSVNISGGRIISGVYNNGDTFIGVIFGGVGISSNAVDNSVNISGGRVEGIVIGGGAYDYGKGAKKNNVNIGGGRVEGSVYGGYYKHDTQSLDYKGTAEDNSVSISGDIVEGSIYGGYVMGNEDSVVKDNSVSISEGRIEGSIYGGYMDSLQASVEDNSVSISGGRVEGSIYGGYASDKEAKGNSITLSGAADVSQASLYGGYSCDNNATVENNKLIINGWSGTVQSINNFNGDDGGIEVKALAGGLDLAAGKATNFITVTGREVKGENEEDVNHIYIENSEIQNNSKQVKDIQAGVALTVSGEIGKDNQNIYINPTSVRASDQTAITTESRAAAAAFVNQGAEAVSDSINSLQGAEAGISTFATVSGNNSKYDTGSYVDINGWNGIVGVAKTKDLNAGKFSYGAFIENGGGNYNTYNDFNGNSFRGDGNVVYNGGGLLMRYEQENGVYTEASLRAGTAKNEVSNALSDMDNKLYGFKTENAYYGAHIGIGKIIKLDNGKAWDVYGKYFHTHHEGDSILIGKDTFDFDSVDSDKLRIGARFSEKQGEKLTSYYGLAWEYEFSGDAGGTANHYAMYTPSLEGSTVIGEVGFRYTPGKESPWYFDANVRGYAGMQEGISGSVQAVYSF